MIDQTTVADVTRFHGHMCPGLAMGIRAAEVALTEIGPHAEDEEVVAVVETDMCGVDAIQALTGCTFGKGNLHVLPPLRRQGGAHRRPARRLEPLARARGADGVGSGGDDAGGARPAGRAARGVGGPAPGC